MLVNPHQSISVWIVVSPFEEIRVSIKYCLKIPTLQGCREHSVTWQVKATSIACLLPRSSSTKVWSLFLQKWARTVSLWPCISEFLFTDGMGIDCICVTPHMSIGALWSAGKTARNWRDVFSAGWADGHGLCCAFQVTLQHKWRRKNYGPCGERHWCEGFLVWKPCWLSMPRSIYLGLLLFYSNVSAYLGNLSSYTGETGVLKKWCFREVKPYTHFLPSSHD